MVIIGEQEMIHQSVAVRKQGAQTTLPLHDFIEQIGLEATRK
jgi:hypothetical protein